MISDAVVLSLTDFEGIIADRPVLPRHIDGQLLRSTGRHLDEQERPARRDSFWTAISTLVPS